jgi:predicted NBD/HSP70 family sugar kinase
VGYLWGIDLGGTKIEGVALSDDGQFRTLCRLRRPTEADRGYKRILQNIGGILVLMQDELRCCDNAPIGICTPGTVDPVTGLMKNCNTTVLNGKPLKADLVRMLGREVRIENDANCFALAEAAMGAARGAETSFGVIMGTGVGGGVVIRGKTLRGVQGIAGEWGHNVLHKDGPGCYCGKRGCVETYLSGPALERRYIALGGKPYGLQDIVDLAHLNVDAAATQVVQELCENFGRALSMVVNILDPEVVVLGGGVSNVRNLYERGVEELRKNVFSDVFRTRVEPPKLGDSAGVYGAAMLTLP